MIKEFTVSFKISWIYAIALILCLIYTAFSTTLTLYGLIKLNWVSTILLVIVFAFPSWVVFFRLLTTGRSKFEKHIIDSYLEKVRE